MRQAGLTEYEAKAYLALLQLGPASGREVAKKSGVPPTRIFDTLRALVDKGLASIVQPKPMIFSAVRPELGLKALMERRISEMRDIETRLLTELKEVRRPPAVPKISERITVMTGYEHMYAYVVELLNRAKREVLVFSVGEEIPYSLKIASRHAVAKGIGLKLIVTKSDASNRHILKERLAEGWKLRHYPSTGEWTFAIFDGQVAMLNVRNPETKDERISIFFEIPALAKSLKYFYNTLWTAGRSIGV